MRPNILFNRIGEVGGSTKVKTISKGKLNERFRSELLSTIDTFSDVMA